VGGELAEPNEFDLVINLKTATAFGRTILKSFVRAGELVENYPMRVVCRDA
jgi:hypothetical protein